MNDSHSIVRPLREADIDHAERDQTDDPIADFRLRRVRLVHELDGVGIGENAGCLGKSDAVAVLVPVGLSCRPNSKNQ